MKFFLLLTCLLGSCCPLMQSLPKNTASNPPPVKRVVLVHGFLETGSTFGLLEDRLKEHGMKCLVPKLRPNDGRGGLEKLAAGLKRDIDAAYGPDDEIVIVGFSMGGLVSRYYLQNLGGAARCRHLITVSSPHNGTLAAWLYPSKGARQMRPNSEFLKDLEVSESHLGEMAVVSYRTRYDLIVVPAESSVWERAENIEHPALLHPLMLTSCKVLQDIERRILAE